MQHIDYPNSPRWQLRRLCLAHLFIVILPIIWFLPISNTICQWVDYKIFELLNKSLIGTYYWQFLWGYLNHSNESWINLIFMVFLNVLGIIYIPKSQRPKAIALVVYFWTFFQIGLLVSHGIFTDLLWIERESPSLVIKPWVSLSKSLNNPKIKDYSDNCFPAGHIFVLIFWLRFTKIYAPSWIIALAYLTTIILCFPRLFSGAHWASDIIFTIVFSSLWYIWAVASPLYAQSINYITMGILGLRVKNNESIIY